MNKNQFRLSVILSISIVPLLLFVRNIKSNDTVKYQPDINNNKVVNEPTEVTDNKSLPKPAVISDRVNISALQVQSSKFAEAAKFLAGMKVDKTSKLAKSQNDQAWKTHASSFDKTWDKLEDKQLSKLKKWADSELKPIARETTIFYPFSGPDFLYAYSLFPNAREYVLVGLEPVGSIPDIEKISTLPAMAANLQWLRSSLADMLQLSFFQTKKMAKDFKQTKLNGVLPILFVFLARTNNTVLDVQYIGINKDGMLQALDRSQNKELRRGVKIDFVPEGESQVRSLYYFSLDLSNEGLRKTPEFTTFVQKLPEPITYLKSASYLMYQDGFSNIRNLILSQSSSLLQDDSGMPVKYFDRSKWNLKFYGNYTRPIQLFSNRYQPELKNIYKSDKTIKKLDFGIGYQFRLNESNLMLATSKEQLQSQP